MLGDQGVAASGVEDVLAECGTRVLKTVCLSLSLMGR